MELSDVIGVRHATLKSNLAAADVAARLGERVDGALNLFGDRPLIGQVGPGRASFRRRLGYRNSFQTVMDVDIQPSGSATSLKARSYMHPYAIVFMAFWVAIMVAAFIGILNTDLEDLGNRGGYLVLVPVVMLLFGLLMVVFGRWIARHDHDRMLETIIRSTEATVVDAPGYQPRSPAEIAASDRPPLFSRQTVLFVVIGALLALGAAGAVFYAVGPAG